MIVRSTIAAVLALGTVALATPAVATETAPRVEVTTKGLDLKSPEGMKALTHRIRAAARAVCPSSDPYEIQHRQCVNKAIASAQTQLSAIRLRKGFDDNQQVALYIAK